MSPERKEEIREFISSAWINSNDDESKQAMELLEALDEAEKLIDLGRRDYSEAFYLALEVYDKGRLQKNTTEDWSKAE